MADLHVWQRLHSFTCCSSVTFNMSSSLTLIDAEASQNVQWGRSESLTLWQLWSHFVQVIDILKVLFRVYTLVPLFESKSRILLRFISFLKNLRMWSFFLHLLEWPEMSFWRNKSCFAHRNWSWNSIFWSIWICYDVNGPRVIPMSYSARSHVDRSYHLKSWVMADGKWSSMQQQRLERRIRACELQDFQSTKRT